MPEPQSVLMRTFRQAWDWFCTLPPNIERFDQRKYYSMLIANFMAFVLHFTWIFVFAMLGFTLLSRINIVSTFIFIFCILLLRSTGMILLAVLIGMTEVVVHQGIAIYFLGWDYGFQYFLLVIVAFAFMMNFRPMAIPVGMFLVSLFSFLGFYYRVQYWLDPHVYLGHTTQEVFLMANVTTAFTILAIMSYVYSEAARKAEAALDVEKQKSERLLLNILPAPIAERLKEDNCIIADHFDSTTVMFSDIVGFTAMSEKVAPAELVNYLNRMFSAFDDLAERHGLEKIKTIGDAYMVAGGFPEKRSCHAKNVSAMALEMLEVVKRFNVGADKPVSIRIGIHTGPAVAGVIGIKKFAYDVWGDTVNTASRMEASGMPGRIQLSEQAAQQLGDEFIVEERGMVELKGKCSMKTFWLVGRRAGHESDTGVTTIIRNASSVSPRLIEEL
jgi:class 3 adenylate cyclase